MYSHYQVARADLILQSLNGANATTLSERVGPISQGELTWAFQWDFDIGAGGSVLISKDKSIAPEPTAFALIGAGAVLLVLRRRSRR